MKFNKFTNHEEESCGSFGANVGVGTAVEVDVTVAVGGGSGVIVSVGGTVSITGAVVKVLIIRGAIQST